MEKLYIVIDVGGSSIKYGLMTEKGEVLEKGSIKTVKEDANKLIDSIGNIVDKYKLENNILGLACSFPGAVNPKTGIIGGGSSIPCIHGPNIKDLLQNRTGLKVSIENDANCAALAEGWLGAAKNNKNYICLVIGTGIGGCIIINNSILRGANLHGGEFGYMLLEDSQDPIGKIWSKKSSTFALVTEVSKRLSIPIDNLNGKKIFEMAEEGNIDIIKIIDKWYKGIARGIFNLQYIIDPEKILIGGAISEREDFIDNINVKLKEMKNDIATLDIKVEKCRFSNDSNLIGALYNFLCQYEVIK
ncbi:ROK family protein [Clostridium fallax]|uniref:Sugar kinase of the NBD/HSP70 family, may contain an N-terminal HTH domain n=1 Tax=Clostridium fallax TaxID=1533 RepID=A0A1M4VU86_9CLOT|nr:ROK family protein [Clostridium fallax]SHE72372.1 Sugar kinase of the NBD/HSP70 family, may contain an N-terminal HTH domain [Clostridium fallax]SQB07689.1 ROK family protein [Clostridium fallax]